uniref:Variable large protein n=1 Tax=Globodera pallida TaxID=36090 RepID=A0A183C0Z7_GLOPA
MVTETAESVASKINDLRNSSIFKSFETKLGAAVTTAKMAASTSIDHLAGIATGGARPSPTEANSSEDGGTKNNSQSPLA